MRNKKEIIILLGTIIFQTTMFSIGKLFSTNSHLIHTDLDEKFPFLSFFIIFYVFWYLMLILVPYILLKYNKEKFYQYNICIIINAILSLIIFILYPTSIMRYEITTNGIFDQIVKLMYAIDNPTVCLPSMHASVCFITIFFSISTKGISKSTRWSMIIISILIILSTLFIKQHVIYDVVASFIITLLVFFLLRLLKRNKNFKNYERRKLL